MAFNKRISLLALTILIAALAGVLTAALIFGIGGKETVASRSAAAFREAQRKGEPVREGAHGHGALSPGAPAQPAHSEHGGSETKASEQAQQESSGMAGHDMSGQPMSTSAPSADAHAGHAMSAQAGPGSPVGREGQPQAPAGGHAGMQHGGSAAPPADSPRGAAVGSTASTESHEGMRHGQEGLSASSPATAAQQPQAVQASPGQPAETLQPDPLDRPAETSVVDARRSAEMAEEMGGGHGMRHGVTSYRQLDAGRDSGMPAKEGGSVAPASPSSPDHRGMQHGSPPPAPPRGPAVKKPPPPNRLTPSAPPAEPTHPPHHSGALDPGAQEHGELR